LGWFFHFGTIVPFELVTECEHSEHSRNAHTEGAAKQAKACKRNPVSPICNFLLFNKLQESNSKYFLVLKSQASLSKIFMMLLHI